MINSESPVLDRPPRRERERQRKTLEFLESAERVFAAKGFHGASMEEIARAAEYATGTLYLYFESKEALYAAVFEHKFREAVESVKERVAGVEDPVEALWLVVRAQLEFAGRNRPFFRIFLREGMEVSKGGGNWERIQQTHRELVEWLANGIIAGQQRGIFREGNPHTYALAFQGMIDGLLREWIGSETETPIEEHAEFIVTLAERGIRA